MKNKYISYLTLIAMFFVSIQVFHHHDLDLSNENVLNHNIESIINEDIHKCDLCKLGYTKFFLTEDTFLFNEVFSSSCGIVQPKAYFYKEIYKISNKSPPLV
jgi:hypothetical protein|tara:strand:+ start:391 stop:696 length:306 start_codon:yes stop_codon:yes gene_type:complete